MNANRKKKLYESFDGNINKQINLIKLLYNTNKQFQWFCEVNKIKLSKIIDNIKKDLPLFYPKLKLTSSTNLEEKFKEAKKLNNDDKFYTSYDIDYVGIFSVHNSNEKIVIFPDSGVDVDHIINSIIKKTVNIKKVKNLELNSKEIILSKKIDNNKIKEIIKNIERKV